MPSINMIAPRRTEKKRLERDMRRLFVVILVELVFALGLGGWVATKMLTTADRMSELDAELSKFQPTVRQIEEYDAATTRLTPKLDLLNAAQKGTMRWYNTLDRMTQSLPPSTWLTRVMSVPAKEGAEPGLNLTGVSVSQERVGELMMLLARHDSFSNVDLHFTEKSEMGTQTVVGFEIGATLNAGESDTPSQGGKTAKGVTGNGPGQS